MTSSEESTKREHKLKKKQKQVVERQRRKEHPMLGVQAAKPLSGEDPEFQSRLRVMDIDEVGAVGSGWRVLEEIEQ